MSPEDTRGVADAPFDHDRQRGQRIAGPRRDKDPAGRQARRRPSHDQVDDVYRVLSRRLRGIVRREVRGPDAAIDDACQTAWTRLLQHQVAEQATVAWLVTVAKREAWKITRGQRRELSLDDDSNAPDRASEAAASLQLEQRELLAALAGLPARQRRVLWLHAMGYSYREIAQLTLQSAKTVERQLLRGRRAARALASEARR